MVKKGVMDWNMAFYLISVEDFIVIPKARKPLLKGKKLPPFGIEIHPV